MWLYQCLLQFEIFDIDLEIDEIWYEIFYLNGELCLKIVTMIDFH